MRVRTTCPLPVPPQDELDEDQVTIVQRSMEEQETHPEDMQDYVNIAPWTRRNSHERSSNAIHSECRAAPPA